MSLSTLPLSYCTNVHPGRTLAEVEHGLNHYTVPMARSLDAPPAAGLWLAQPVVQELLQPPEQIQAFAERLRARGLTCHTLNAFPFGDFHSERVKENVYLPDWSDPLRREYTADCARILTTLLENGTDGSLSTVPLGFKEFMHPPDFLDRCADELIDCARQFDRLRSETGRTVRLAIEPEPFCVLETTRETLDFFRRLHERAADVGAFDLVREHIGVCYDVCHQAVEFEDVEASIAELTAAGVRINKVHITCALQLDRPAENTEGRAALARYAEPRYLHQVFARQANGKVSRAVDLTESLARSPEPGFREAEAWRIHFHVPVDAEQLGPLATTRNELKRVLRAVAGLDYAPHLEVETYTWEVLPDRPKLDLVEGLRRELSTTRELLSAL